MLPLLEFELEDDDGNVYPLATDTHNALEVSGLGMPPVRHWTTRSPYTHGRTHWGYAYGARMVNLVLAGKGCGRGGMYEMRRTNIGMLSPESSPLKLRLRVPEDELVYELHDGWYQNGYGLTSADQSYDPSGQWNQVGGAQIEFEDPFWKWTNSPLDVGETRDADGRTCVEEDTWVTAAAMVLPFTGPYLMGVTPGTLTLTATNDGSAAVLPVITLEGPTEDWVLSNGANDDYIYSDGITIAAGETWTIDVPAKTATSDVVGDVSTYLRGDTATFQLDPGANALTLYSSAGAVNGTTTLGVCWFLELLGT